MKKTLTIIGTLIAGGLLYLGPHFGAAPTIQDIQTKEEAFYSKHGFYRQIEHGKEINVNGNAATLGITLPSHYDVNTYVGPKGDGYQIVIDDGTTITAQGFGPQAAEYTYTKTRPIIVATTTP